MDGIRRVPLYDVWTIRISIMGGGCIDMALLGMDYGISGTNL